MTEKSSRSTEILSEITEAEMDISAASPSELVRYIEDNLPKRYLVKSAIEQVADALAPYLARRNKPPIKPSRVYDIRGEECVPKYWEMDALRAEAGRLKRARDDIRNYRQQVTRLEAMVLRNKNRHRTRLDALYVASRGAGRPLDREHGGRG